MSGEKKPRSSLSTEVYENIKNMIFSRELRQGDRIPEERMAEFTGGSRTPVREALRMLAAEGLVLVTPRRCATVREYDAQATADIGAVRLVQDLLAARLAIQYGSYQDFLDMRLLMEECETRAKNGDIAGFIQADNDFHLRIVQVGGNDVLMENQVRVYQITRLLQASNYSTAEAGVFQVRHHHEILEGISSRDYPRACRAICDHLQEYYHVNPSIVETYRGSAPSP